ncbi:MAG: UDP-N-acetylglucosamine pyrophosphorylase [Clostridiaceae bacterium]|nr:UDP-N-acetylglucosamine pyrophosphorylase [Clostridiaceae bacterium]
MVIGIQITDLLDLEKTIAAEIFADREFVWEVLSDITEFIRKKGKTLNPEEYESRGDDVYISKSAKIYPSAMITGPCIIDHGAEIRHCAFIRGSAIVGKNAVVGNSTELKNVILFDSVQVPHYNYVGDSVLGFKAHMGAGAITSNVKSDHSLTTFRFGEEKVPTGMKKFGAIIGDFTEIGCNSVLNPATIIGRNATVYPLSMVRGYVPANSIYKKQGEVVGKRE